MPPPTTSESEREKEKNERVFFSFFFFLNKIKTKATDIFFEFSRRIFDEEKKLSSGGNIYMNVC